MWAYRIVMTLTHSCVLGKVTIEAVIYTLYFKCFAFHPRHFVSNTNDLWQQVEEFNLDFL